MSSALRLQRSYPSPQLCVPALDLKAQYQSIRDEIDAAVGEVLASQVFIMGPKVIECEQAIAAYCGAKHAVGVSSGTDALLIALMAEGIGAGDEVITTPYSFFATAGCIARVGAAPVFVDIDPLTYNIDATLIEEKITSNTKAIIPVHLFGLMADMDPIMEIARRYGLTVIEDAAQAIGAEYRGCRAGSIGDYGCFSFFPAKNLGAAGDGGMVIASDPNRAEKLCVLRAHGSKPKYYHHVIGGNFRLDALQAAIVTVKLRYLEQWTAARRRAAALYNELFDQSGLVERGVVSVPRISQSRTAIAPSANGSRQSTGSNHAPETSHVIPDTAHRHVFNQYLIRVKQRDELQKFLGKQNIASAIYYPRSLHEQACFAYLGYLSGDFPQAERASQETLALPIYPEISDQQIEFVVDHVQQFYCA